MANNPRAERRHETREMQVDRRKSDLDVIEHVALGVRRTHLFVGRRDLPAWSHGGGNGAVAQHDARVRPLPLKAARPRRSWFCLCHRNESGVLLRPADDAALGRSVERHELTLRMADRQYPGKAQCGRHARRRCPPGAGPTRRGHWCRSRSESMLADLAYW